MLIFFRKNSDRVLMTFFYTVWKNEKFTATQIFFRQINLQESSVVKR